MKKFIFAMLLSIAGIMNLAHADVIAGDGSNASAVRNSCFPFGCPQGVSDGRYQQMYQQKDFSNASNLTSMSFNIIDHPWGFNDVKTSDGYFTISLSTASKLDTGMFDTGTNSQVVFQGFLPEEVYGNTLKIDFDKSYFYDPSLGKNLLLDITWEGATLSDENLYNTVWLESGTGIQSQEQAYGAYQFGHEYGLITNFTTVPEPASLALFGLGIFGLGLSRRRKQK